MIATICFVTITIVYLAALGRSASPPDERLPWRAWSAQDWAANVIRGARRSAELQKRNPLGPHHHGPL